MPEDLTTRQVWLYAGAAILILALLIVVGRCRNTDETPNEFPTTTAPPPLSLPPVDVSEDPPAVWRDFEPADDAIVNRFLSPNG